MSALDPVKRDPKDLPRNSPTEPEIGALTKAEQALSEVWKLIHENEELRAQVAELTEDRDMLRARLAQVGEPASVH